MIFKDTPLSRQDKIRFGMSSGGQFTSPEDGGSSEDSSHFSSAARCGDGDDEGAARSSTGRSSTGRSSAKGRNAAGTKRKRKHEAPNGGCEFDDTEFSFSERDGDADKLLNELNVIAATDIPVQGGGDRGGIGRRRKQQGGQQQAAMTTRRAPRVRDNTRGRGRANRPSSSTFLDKADAIQRTEGGGDRTADRSDRSGSRSRRTKPPSLTATPTRDASPRSKGKAKAYRGGTGASNDRWMNTRGAGEATLGLESLGRVGRNKMVPSTTTARARTRNAQNAQISANAKSQEEHIIDILSDDDDAGSTPTKDSGPHRRDSTTPAQKEAGSTPLSDRSHEGVRWNTSDSEGEDFVGKSADSNSSTLSIKKAADAAVSIAKRARSFFTGRGSNTRGEYTRIIAQGSPYLFCFCLYSSYLSESSSQFFVN